MMLIKSAATNAPSPGLGFDNFSILLKKLFLWLKLKFARSSLLCQLIHHEKKKSLKLFVLYGFSQFIYQMLIVKRWSLIDLPMESILEIYPYNGFSGLPKLIEPDLLKTHGVSNPPPKNTNSITVLKLIT
jgi:hypothetical protein